MIDIHVHTKYSLLDAMSEPEELIKKVKNLGRKGICITEHGNLYSSIEVYKLCQQYNIKYLHGCEVYICNDVNEKSKNSKYNHLILISKNETGRQNLLNLISLSTNYKYYGKPRIDFNMLMQHKEGLIVVSACMAGEVQRVLMTNNIEEASNIALKYKNAFGEDYYLEYQSHSEETQQKLNRLVVDLANNLGIKYVVTTDSHYVNKEDQKYHSVFVQIGQAREVGETYNDCYIQTDDEILNICRSTTREENLIAMNNTEEILNKCDVNIPLSAPIMPHVQIPNQFKSEIEYLQALSIDGWKKRKIHLLPKLEQEKYKLRLKYEIDVIEKMGFEGYYLLVWSYANSVKRRGIARGSGGGSLVAYLINIVDTDPIKYGLYFERFIDVGALQLLEEGKITKSQLKIPDFDLDFGKADRDKVMQYIINTYGKSRVASLGSFQYIWAKGAIKDIGRVLSIPFEITNEMTGKLDKETISEALELGILDEYKNKYPELFEYAIKLAGMPKSFSMHPCGKIITMQSVGFYNAVEVNEETNEYVLQGDMHTAEDLGLIKIDLLGLRTVDIIYDVLDMIGKDYEYIAPHNLNFNDKKVLQNFRNGYTSGIFQFESDGMKGTLSNIECNSLYDLSVANALYRPGSMDYISNYANRRKGIEEYEFLHDDLKEILKDSYAIIVFQEQLIEIGRIAKLSNPDELRQATAKKKDKLMAKIKPELFNGLRVRGWSDDKLEELWDVMIKFAKYSFNKSHSVAYAIIAYICMYLKTYHPKEFMAAWINSYNGKVEKLPQCITEANRMNVKIYKPNWNEVQGLTCVKNDKVLLGTQSIKYLNAQIADELRELGSNKYNNFIELLKDIKEKTSIDSRQLKILTGLNFFKEFGNNKKLLQSIEIFDNFDGRKQIKKSEIEKLGLTENIIKKYSNKETEALYKELDIIGLISTLTENLENKPMSIKDQVQFEKEYLEYVEYTNEKAGKNFYIITEYTTYKDATKPYVTLRNVKTGENLKTKIKDSSIFTSNPFKLYDILKVNEFKVQKKTKCVNGKWQKTNEDEKILYSYEVY